MRQVWARAQLAGAWPLALLGGAALLLALLAAPQTVGPWLLCVALLLIPGLALARLVPLPLTAAERLALALCAGCALPPLLLEAAWLSGVRFGSLLAWGTLLLCAAALWPRRPPAPLPAEQRAPLALLAALTLAALALRAYAARDLPAGMWGDSYHHTMIAQLLAERGGIFGSWQPYAPLTTLTYHFGFHALVAWLSWLGGVPATAGVLLVGQAQSALAAPAAFLLTRRITGDDRAALWAALAAGFLSAMPAYSLNWGRYTQLAGQLLLPAVVVAWGLLLEAALTAASRRAALRLGVLAGLLTGALALTHYRVLAFAACAVVAWWTVALLQARPRPATLLRLSAYAVPTALLAAAIGLPWALHIRNGTLLRIGQHFLSVNIGALETNNLPSIADFLQFYSGVLVLVLAAIGLLVACVWQRRALIIPLWAGLVALAANPYVLGLPGAGILTNNAVLVASYLALAPLAGLGAAALAGWGARWRGPRPDAHPKQVAEPAGPLWPSFLGFLVVRPNQPYSAGRVLLFGELALAALAILSTVGWQAQIVDPRYELLTPADARALGWLIRSTPPDARVAVNSFPAYGNTLYAGSDGGWWLPLLAHRQTNLPPITYGSEASDPPDFLEQTNALNAALAKLPLGSKDAARILRANGFSYLYDGPANSGQPERFTPQMLANTPGLKQVYAQDGVTIWQVR